MKNQGYAFGKSLEAFRAFGEALQGSLFPSLEAEIGNLDKAHRDFVAICAAVHGDFPAADGAPIDLVLDRADNVVNVCELKYSRDAFVIDKEYETALGRKIATFAGVNRLKKAVHLTMVSAGGLVRNAHSGRVQSVVTLDDLFRP